jgi:hypothetical protein
LIGGGEDGGTVGPQAEEGRVPQGDLPGVADEEIEAQNRDDIEPDKVENPQVIGLLTTSGVASSITDSPQIVRPVWWRII